MLYLVRLYVAHTLHYDQHCGRLKSIETKNKTSIPFVMYDLPKTDIL